MALPEIEILELTPARARLRFAGPFEGRRVCWDCTLIALGSGRHMPVRQYLDVHPQARDPIPITVGLAVETLDRPALLKAAIMVTQYRQLHRGHHTHTG